MLLALIKSVLLAVVLLIYVAYVILADRKIWAAVQIRRGPNVVGPWGLFQSFADLLKFVLKEPVIPAGANKGVFLLAPFLSGMLALAAIPIMGFVGAAIDFSRAASARTAVQAALGGELLGILHRGAPGAQEVSTEAEHIICAVEAITREDSRAVALGLPVEHVVYGKGVEHHVFDAGFANHSRQGGAHGRAR